MNETPDDVRLRDAELDSLSRAYRGLPADAPPDGIDAAILARARAALERKARLPRWWVPATLAATVVVAFSLVMRVQQEALLPPADTAAGDAPAREPLHATESAAAANPATPDAVVEEVQETPSADRPVSDAAAPAARPAPALPREAAPVPAEVEPRRSTESAQVAADIKASGTARRAPAVASQALAGAAVADAAEAPEAWLARIEALEAAGEFEAAAVERARLEAAHPGWLARHAAERE